MQDLQSSDQPLHNPVLLRRLRCDELLPLSLAAYQGCIAATEEMALSKNVRFIVYLENWTINDLGRLPWISVDVCVGIRNAWVAGSTPVPGTIYQWVTRVEYSVHPLY